MVTHRHKNLETRLKILESFVDLLSKRVIRLGDKVRRLETKEDLR